MSVPQGWGVRPARDAVLCVSGVGHLVTHTLIKISISRALRVTKVISAAADLWGKSHCLSPGLRPPFPDFKLFLT